MRKTDIIVDKHRERASAISELFERRAMQVAKDSAAYSNTR